MPTEVLAELSDNRKYIRVVFPFDWNLVEGIKRISGSKFIPQEKGGPAWRLPLDLETGNSLRKLCGEQLKLGPELRAWGHKESAHKEQLKTLKAADDAELEVLPVKAPLMYEFISSRPYQRADIAFMAASKAPLNANQPGLGKTIEVIAAVFESQLDEGPNLILAPITSLDVVWEYELLRFDQPHWVLIAPPDRAGRLEMLQEAKDFYDKGEPFWLVVNPAMVTFKKKFKKGTGEEVLEPPFPIIQDIDWNCVIIDEFHKCGLGNSASLTARAVKKLKSKKNFAISGTPIQGKPIKLFSVLQFLHPEEFTSKWAFAGKWLEVTEGYQGTKKIGQIQEDKEEAFYRMLEPYMVRRTKEQVAPQLPPKQYVNLLAHMDGKQEKQYKAFAQEAEVRIEDLELSATSILAEYTYLKQFAMAEQTVVGIDKNTHRALIRPTTNSCKMPHLLRILEERGITGDEEADGEEQVVVFSQFTKVVKMVTRHLQDLGIKTEYLVGETTRQERTELVRKFQAGTGPRVLVMNTTAGGVAITLDRASTVVFLDETWTPDDQEQAEDRVHRASKIHQVTVYYIRTADTIEQYIENMVLDKSVINKKILDIRKEGLRATYE